MSKIDTLVQEFVVNLRLAIAEEAAAAFAAVAGGGLQSGQLVRGKRKPGPKPGKAVAGKPLTGKRSRRSAEDIENQAAAILSFIKKNPASKAEAIGQSVGMTSIQMQAPIAQLLNEKKISKKGQRRATSYSAK